MPRTHLSRRTILGATAAITAGLAGCSGSGSTDGGAAAASGGSDGDDAQPSAESYLSDTSNYDGVVDETGRSEVSVTVGAESNGGNWGYGPAAIRVSPGTTVVWEWNGRGGPHNVVAEDESFRSEQVTSAGHTFSQTFSEPGTTLYYCTPHRGLGMKGAVVVEGSE
ncbi:halocyanin domain-containing protein [Halobellus sp. Atlit-31R]|nr:halocyanin domain-containing protein [Halobellus sp. Atlit-31R]